MGGVKRRQAARNAKQARFPCLSVSAVTFLYDDGFCNPVMHALSVAMNEKLDESEAAFEERSSVTETSFGGLPQSDPWAREGDDTDVQQALAHGEAIGAPDSESRVSNEIQKVFEIAGVVLDGNVDWLMRNFEFDVLTREFDRRENEEHDEKIDDESGSPLPETSQRKSGKGFQARNLVRVEETNLLARCGGLRAFHGSTSYRSSETHQILVPDFCR